MKFLPTIPATRIPKANQIPMQEQHTNKPQLSCHAKVRLIKMPNSASSPHPLIGKEKVLPPTLMLTFPPRNHILLQFHSPRVDYGGFGYLRWSC